MASQLGAYGALAVIARDDGTVALDFTAKGASGPYLVLNAIQWRALQMVIRSLPAPR